MTPEHDDVLRRGALDPRLVGIPLRVFVYLLPDLDFDEFRPVKILLVARQLRMNKGNVSRALRSLALTAHLETGPAADRVFTYRIARAGVTGAVGKVAPGQPKVA